MHTNSSKNFQNKPLRKKNDYNIYYNTYLNYDKNSVVVYSVCAFYLTVKEHMIFVSYKRIKIIL